MCSDSPKSGRTLPFAEWDDKLGEGPNLLFDLSWRVNRDPHFLVFIMLHCKNGGSFMTRIRIAIVVLSVLQAFQSVVAGGANMVFWNAYDAREEPLNAETLKSWDDTNGVYRLVRYRVARLTGSNKSAMPVIAAYYGYPFDADDRARVPGIVHIHGGGQRASRQRVEDWVKLGYACISINWGGKVLESADTPNTDWDGLAAGFERPGASKQDQLLHHNLVRPGPNTLFKEPHLLNSSWNLIAMSARRALTFLEERSEVDADRLGVEGHSMGGRSTVLTAIDPRVKAASPSVGGSGYLYQDMWGLPGSARRMQEADGLALYSEVVSAQSYWLHIKAPLLFLQAANDFNAPMDFVAKGMSRLPAKTERMLAVAPHLNHRFTTETAAARFMWMEAHLKGNFTFPKRSPSQLVLDTPNGIPQFRVDVDRSSGLNVDKVEVYYGYARDPRIRFWRSAEVERDGESVYWADCPVFDVAEPLFAFANITYRMPRKLPARPGASATDQLTVTSEYQSAYPDALQAAGVLASEKRGRIIDDFSRGWQDWYRLNANNPHHWFYATRKVVDPTWMGPVNGELAVDVVTTDTQNWLAIGVEVNNWQGYTGRKRDTYHAIVALEKAGKHSLPLPASKFRNQSGQVLSDWDEVNELTFTPANRIREISEVKSNWRGAPLGLENLRWVGGAMTPRLHPHEKRGTKTARIVSFKDEFRKAIDDSVALEHMDKQAVASTHGTVYLTKEMAVKIESFVRVRNDRSWAGGAISVGGKTYARGLGVHADSWLTFPLGGKFSKFHVIPGPDDAHRGRLEMKILVDGKEVYTTGPTSSRDRPRKPIEISVATADSLTLVVDSLGERGGDHASWAGAVLSLKEPDK